VWKHKEGGVSLLIGEKKQKAKRDATLKRDTISEGKKSSRTDEMLETIEGQRGKGTLLNFLILPLMNFPSLGDEVRNGPRGESQLFHQLSATCFAALFRQIAVKGPCPDDLPNSAGT
jgi:hypothetical protein